MLFYSAAAAPPCIFPVLIPQDFPKNSSAVTVNFGSSSADKWPSGCAVIDFLITSACELQFNSLVLKQTDHTPVLPPHSVCVCPFSQPPLFCCWSLNAPAPSPLILSPPNSTLHYLSLYPPSSCSSFPFVSVTQYFPSLLPSSHPSAPLDPSPHKGH